MSENQDKIMSNVTKSAIGNTIIVGLFLAMITGIASWNVNAIKDNTKAVTNNTTMGYENRLADQKRHNELSGLVIGINYEIAHLNQELNKVESDCNRNTLELGKCRADRLKDHIKAEL